MGRSQLTLRTSSSPIIPRASMRLTVAKVACRWVCVVSAKTLASVGTEQLPETVCAACGLTRMSSANPDHSPASWNDPSASSRFSTTRARRSTPLALK